MFCPNQFFHHSITHFLCFKEMYANTIETIVHIPIQKSAAGILTSCAKITPGISPVSYTHLAWPSLPCTPPWRRRAAGIRSTWPGPAPPSSRRSLPRPPTACINSDFNCPHRKRPARLTTGRPQPVETFFRQAAELFETLNEFQKVV